MASISSKTPMLDAYFDRLNAVIDANNCDRTLLVKGFEKDEKEDDERDYSEKELTTLRFFIVNDRIDKLFTKKHTMVMNFYDTMGDTSAGNFVIYTISDEVVKAMKKRTSSEKFDELFSLTVVLNRNHSWLYDNEEYEEVEGGALRPSVLKLINAWKKLYPLSNADLGIDAEFSRPALQTLLQQFICLLQEKVGNVNFKRIKEMIE